VLDAMAEVDQVHGSSGEVSSRLLVALQRRERR
jgi:hypothetical protein